MSISDAQGMADVLGYLKQTRNALIGNPSAKLSLQRTRESGGFLLASIVSYINICAWIRSEDAGTKCPEDTIVQIRIEAANVITSLAHGPRDIIPVLLDASATTEMLKAISGLTLNDPKTLHIALVRAFRALCVALADCAGPPLWGLGDDCSQCRNEVWSLLDYIFQVQALDIYLPLLESPIPVIQLYIAQLLASAVRVQKHRIAVIEWLPPDERFKDNMGRKGKDVTELTDSEAADRLGGWVIRHLTEMLKNKDFNAQDTILYALSALIKDNPTVALTLCKYPPDNSNQQVFSIASDLTRDRRSEVQLAACLCVANILRSASPALNRQRSRASTIIHVLNSIMENDNEPPSIRTKACHILSKLVIDDIDRSINAWKSGSLSRLASLLESMSQAKVSDWEDGEARDVSRLREAALTAVGALCLQENDIRNDAAGQHSILPAIGLGLEHPVAGVRYGACLCVRALARSVRMLRTRLLDSGVGITLCTIIERHDEDRRVMNIALAGLCNLLNDFSPLRKTLLERGVACRLAGLLHSPEDAIRVGALWAFKNLLNKATTEEKQNIMCHLGWDHLKTCLGDPKEEIQEQALNIIANIASSEQHIDMLFENIPESELMRLVVAAMGSKNEDIVCQAAHVLANISNGGQQHRKCLVGDARVLYALRPCLEHPRADIQMAAAGCIDGLSREHPHRLRDSDLDETLRVLLHDARDPDVSGAGAGAGSSLSATSYSSSADRMRGGSGMQVSSNAREIASNMLRIMDDLGYAPMQ